MNATVQVLFIAHSFPPSPEVGGRRIASFCRHLPGFGIRPIVLTVNEQCLQQRDDSYPAPDGVRIEWASEMTNPLLWYARLKKLIRSGSSDAGNGGRQARPAEVSPRQELGFVPRQVFTLLDTPDRHLRWYLPAARAAARLIKSERIAVVVSSGPPWTAHLVARHLRKKYGVPWVADFRDPWASAQSHRPRWASRLHYSMESSCVRWADLVICNTEALRQDFIARSPALPASKFVTLTGGFDDSVIPQPEPKGSRRILLHLGDIYLSRRIDTFCQAMRSLIDSGKIEPNSVKVLFVGEVDPMAKFAAGRQLSDLIGHELVEFIPRMNWQQAQRLLWGADLLLLFQGDFKTQVPAKFYEYLQTGKPIFAVAARGALTELLESTGAGVWAEPEDAGGIASSLLRALQLPAIPPEEAARRWSGRFHARSLTAQLARWIRQLAAQHSPGPVVSDR